MGVDQKKPTVTFWATYAKMFFVSCFVVFVVLGILVALPVITFTIRLFQACESSTSGC